MLSNVQTSTSFQTQALNMFKLQTFKLRSRQTLKLLNSKGFRNFEIHVIYRSLKVSILQTSNLPKFRTFKLSILQTPWASNFQAPAFQTFKRPPPSSTCPSPHVPHTAHVAPASNFRAGFTFKPSNPKLALTFKLETYMLSNLRLLILQAFRTFKPSNLVLHLIRSIFQRFEFENPNSPTRDI